jgi:hypothetical protein
MDGKSERTFCPQLETFEKRDLLSTFNSFFPGMTLIPSLPSLRRTLTFPTFNFSHPPTLASGGSSTFLTTGSSPATSVHLFVSPGGGKGFNYSLVPTQQGFGLTNIPKPVTLFPSFDAGFTTRGLITPASMRSDPGISIPGINVLF